ncbi:MAG: hypothetical protein Q9P14_13890 [candidate division KSB1 bacterium]|nr:hypothetical protein [candidate division KSB1 bacterium]
MVQDQVKKSRQEMRQMLLYNLWQKIQSKAGSDPFLIAAQQNISISLHLDDERRCGEQKRIGEFRPDAMTIEIFVEPLKIFWRELFPGCSLSLKYRYVCWRELWNYWVMHRFAPISGLLQKAWPIYLKEFSRVTSVEQQYLSHYFACLATGVLEQEPKTERSLNSIFD